jgi:hypothetical protein
MPSIYDTIADMTTTEALTYFHSLDVDRLTTLQQAMEPLQTKIAEQQTILDDYKTKVQAQSSMNAWKRKGAPVATVTESAHVTDAKLLMEKLQTTFKELEKKASVIQQRIQKYQEEQEEEEEVRLWSENLRLPSKTRPVLPTPARIRRMDDREREEREESMSKPGWTRLPLDHQSPEGKARREAYNAHILPKESPEFQVQQDAQTETNSEPVVPDIQVPVQEKIVRSRLPWWYAKYNVSLEV